MPDLSKLVPSCCLGAIACSQPVPGVTESLSKCVCSSMLTQQEGCRGKQ